jgi:hypothetical protein
VVFVLFAGAWLLLCAPACSFDPTGSAAGPGGDDSSVGGSDDTVDDGGSAADAGPGTPDAEVPVKCEPGATVCGADGRSLNVCNPAGDGYSQSVVCPFACEADDHCTLASNLPQATQEACTGDAPALTPPPGATVTIAGTGDGRIECDPDCGDGATDFIDAAGVVDDGPQQLAHFCLSQLDIPADVNVTAGAGLPRSVLLFVTGSAVVAGAITVDGASATQTTAGAGGPGGSPGAAGSGANGAAGGGNCPGQGGIKADEQGPNDDAGGGGGGGGYGAGGGTGGDGRGGGATPTTGAGGAAGSICGEADLDPLVGGSGGGGGADGSCGGDCGWPGGGGGGALQISAIRGVTISGTLDAQGGDGFGSTDANLGRGGGGGGGAGGGILLEGPVLTIDAGALVVEGGAGGAALAGNGGSGGAAGTASGGNGTDADADNEGGAGGGGSGGRVRLNATTATACTGVASPDGVCDEAGLRRGGGIGGQ